MRNSHVHPGSAAILSLIVPGVGQIYAGRWLWAIFFFILTPGFWLGSGGLIGWIMHIIAAWHAHGSAVRSNRRLARAS